MVVLFVKSFAFLYELGDRILMLGDVTLMRRCWGSPGVLDATFCAYGGWVHFGRVIPRGLSSAFVVECRKV